MTLNDLEKKRKKYRNRIFLSIIIFVIIIYYTFTNVEALGEIVFLPVVIGVAISLLLTLGPKKRYIKAYKDYFVLKGLKEIFTNLKYDPDSGMPRDTIANTHMMNMGDVYNSNDFVSGKYKNVAFKQADVHIQKEYESTDSDGHTTTEYVTIFRGRWMVFDFNKEFKANVQVAQKGFGNNRVKKDGCFLKKKIIHIIKMSKWKVNLLIKGLKYTLKMNMMHFIYLHHL